MKVLEKSFILALGVSLLLACGSSKLNPRGQEDEVPTTLEPTRIKASRDGERLVVEAYNAEDLFEKGGKLLRTGRCEKAVPVYQRIFHEFPDSRLVPLALYNQGLCLDELMRFEEAARAYRKLIEDYPESEDVKDALFRMSGSYEHMEAWEQAIAVFDILLHERKDLKGVERVEALARKGSALIRASRNREAELVLTEAVNLFRSGRGISSSDSYFYYCMAQFKLAEIVHGKMRATELPSDENILKESLEEKATLLLEAQRLYTKVIRIGDPHWAAAAAYRIGSLYHHLWEDMLLAPPPDDLDEEAKQVYLDVLRKKIRVLLKKAVLQWERTLQLAIRLKLDNDWIDSTKRDLEQIRYILEIEDAEEITDTSDTAATP